MSERKECVAMLLAGGQGSRLAPLTKNTAKPAVPFGGKYRIIDFSLSNCVNSGIDTVGVLTQYQPLELNDYLGRGDPWDMNLKYGGLHVLPPYQAEAGGDWFKGTANAIYQNIRFLRQYSPKYVLILSGDHIYKMNYRKMLDQHIENQADCTIAVIDVAPEEASRFGIMNTDETGRIVEFEEKPTHPKSTLASMGVYIFTAKKLLQYLTEDENDPHSVNDFGKNVIPRMLHDDQRMFAYTFNGYWRDVGTLSSFWAAHMDVLGENPLLRLNDPSWRIYYRHGFTHPEYISKAALLENSIIGDGGDMGGTCKNSVVFSDVIVEEGSVIEDSVIMTGCVIGAGAHISQAVIGEYTTIDSGSTIGAPVGKGALTVLADHLQIPANGHISAGEIVDKETMEGDE